MLSSRRDVLAVFVLTALVAVVAVFQLVYHARSAGWGRSAGFGPEWDCTHVGKGDPVCVKTPAANAGNMAPPTR